MFRGRGGGAGAHAHCRSVETRDRRGYGRECHPRAGQSSVNLERRSRSQDGEITALLKAISQLMSWVRGRSGGAARKIDRLKAKELFCVVADRQPVISEA